MRRKINLPLNLLRGRFVKVLTGDHTLRIISMRRYLAFLLAAVLILPAFSLAQPAQQTGNRRHPMQMRERMLGNLGLSDEQRGQIRKLALDHQKAQTEMTAKIQVARLDLRELFLADKPDRDAIAKQMGVVSDFQQKAKLSQLDHMFAVYKILTPEQQKKWREHMAHFGEGAGPMMRHGRTGKGMGMGMGIGMMEPQDQPMGLMGDEPIPEDPPVPDEAGPGMQ